VSVQWVGSDLGVGIESYTVLVSDNGGPYTPFATNTTETLATFHGQPGHTYSFYSIARDRVGNVEQPPARPDWTVMMSLCAANVTEGITVKRGAFRFDRRTERYSQQVVLRNTGSAAITGPFALVIEGLPSTVSVASPHGFTACKLPRSPFIGFTAGADGVLNPGESATVGLQFLNPTDISITYSLRVLAGAGER
jgi:hypothetical protein